jgi:hypothetical protein
MSSLCGGSTAERASVAGPGARRAIPAVSTRPRPEDSSQAPRLGRTERPKRSAESRGARLQTPSFAYSAASTLPGTDPSRCEAGGTNGPESGRGPVPRKTDQRPSDGNPGRPSTSRQCPPRRQGLAARQAALRPPASRRERSGPEHPCVSHRARRTRRRRTRTNRAEMGGVARAPAIAAPDYPGAAPDVSHRLRAH